MLKPMPMLAKPLTDNFSPGRDMYVAEEKFDGHRMIVEVRGDVAHREIEAWSRTGKLCTQKIHEGMRYELQRLPVGTYDGELVFPGGHSYDVTVLENRSKLLLVLFDVLTQGEADVTPLKYCQRRSHLENIFVALHGLNFVHLAKTWPIMSREQLDTVVEEIWERNGEGVIVKDMFAPYLPGKRTKHFMKIKQCQSAVLTVVGFAPSQGELNNRGRAGITVLHEPANYHNPAGGYAVVKTLDDATCRRLEGRFLKEESWERVKIAGQWVEFNTAHEDVGRTLRVEFHERTPDSLRHARWDRWEEE